MTTSVSAWVAGARPNTLPASVAPVIAGLAAAVALESSDEPFASVRWAVLGLTVLIALALQVGVNYANDYSDGVRGTDNERVGPTRLVASGQAQPRTVKMAAFASFGVAAAAGLVAVILTGHWWLLVVGVACLVAGWFYTGGKKPYGYLGLGEVMVFVFFGLVATVGTTYLQTDQAPAAAWVAAVGVGALASALLVVNNLRDLPRDAQVGKRTLATRLGDRGTRLFYLALVVMAGLSVLGFAALTSWYALIALMGVLVLVRPTRDILAGATGRSLIPMLKATGLAELGLAVGLLVGLFVS